MACHGPVNESTRARHGLAQLRKRMDDGIMADGGWEDGNFTAAAVIGREMEMHRLSLLRHFISRLLSPFLLDSPA